MNDYDKLKEEFDSKVEVLQNICNHAEITDWIEEQWAIGHSTGLLIKQCKNCYVIVTIKTSCHRCKKEIIDDDIILGDGVKTFSGSSYCIQCFDAGDEEITRM